LPVRLSEMNDSVGALCRRRHFVVPPAEATIGCLI